jgi:small subunit ribosomal protein S1
VLDINKDKQEISLGMRQTEVNPWTLVKEKYPAGTVIEGRVRNLTNYGAFIEIEEGIDGLLHVSDMSWTKKVAHPQEIVKKGQKVRAVVLSVDSDKKRVALGMKQLEEDPWSREIPEKFHPGDIVKGTVTKLTNFGVFVEIDHDLEGLLHISELSDAKVETPEEMVKVGQEINVVVLRVDMDDRKIGLSLKRVPAEYNPGLHAKPAEGAEAPGAGTPAPASAEAAPVTPSETVPGEPAAVVSEAASQDAPAAAPPATEEKAPESPAASPDATQDAPPAEPTSGTTGS